MVAVGTTEDFIANNFRLPPVKRPETDWRGWVEQYEYENEDDLLISKLYRLILSWSKDRQG